MKHNVLPFLCIVLFLVGLMMGGQDVFARVLTSSSNAGGVPSIVMYQGYVTNSGLAYEGTGYFKFAVVNATGDTTFWSNDNSSSGGIEPTDAVSLTVSGGLFNVLLGDTSLSNMTTLTATSFDGPERYLRVWFSDDNATFTLLSPDQRIAAVPYALQADEAGKLDGMTSGEFWHLGGNAGTTSGTDYLGTTDLVSLTLGVNGNSVVTLDTNANMIQSMWNPVHVGAITDDGTTALAQSDCIYVSGKYAYVTAWNDDGVEILDISSPTNPTHVGAIIDDGITALDGPTSIYVSGEYAYVTALEDDGVEILDISDPTNPTHVGKITDDGTTELEGSYDIYVSGNYAYVAANYDNGVEVLDISNPSDPIHVGAITDDSTTALYGAVSIYVSGKYAYVAAFYDHGVEILDISDPANPTHEGAIMADGTTKLYYPSSIYVSGRYAYVTSVFDNAVEILDISDPANPTHIGSITDDGTTELLGAYSIYIAGKYAYVASIDDNGVEILDISDPTNPFHIGAITDGGTTELEGARDIFVSGKYAFVAAYNDDGVEVLDISGLIAPTANIGSLSAGHLAVDVNAQIVNDLYIGNGLVAGPGGIQSGGDVGVQGSLKVNGAYIQFPTITGAAPPASDCNEASEAGRVVVRTDGTTNLYICDGSAWIGK